MTTIHQLLNFYDAPAAASFNLPPTAAMSYAKAKGLKATFDWRDMLGAEHANAFTIAKMADLDLLADIQASLDDAISQGLSFRSWADTITPILQAKGWWGRQAVTDPLTGETIVAQLGSPGRLKTIFRTNVQAAYAVGQWEEIQANAEIAPYLLYDAVDDHRTRPEHKAWDNTVLPVGHPWWKAHYPPNGWNCRCGVIQLSEDDLEDLGLAPNTKAPGGGSYEWKNPRTGKVEKVPAGLDPGWNVNQGEIRLQQLQQLAAQKLKKLKPQDAIAGAKGIKAAEKQAQTAAIDAGITAAPEMKASEAQLAKGAGKAQIRAAEAKIKEELNRTTPLAKALRQLRGTKAGRAIDATEQMREARRRVAAGTTATTTEAWKPEMTAAQAASWAADSAETGTFRHYTDAGSAIRREGFKLDHAGSGAGDVFNRGVYLLDPTDRATTAYYSQAIGRNYVDVKVNLGKVKRVAFDYIAGGKVHVGNRVIDDIAPPGFDQVKVAVLDGIPDVKRKLARALKDNTTIGFGGVEYPDLDKAITQVLREEGYDAVYITNGRFNEAIGGSQLIVLDPHNVTVLKK